MWTAQSTPNAHSKTFRTTWISVSVQIQAYNNQAALITRDPSETIPDLAWFCIWMHVKHSFSSFFQFYLDLNHLIQLNVRFPIDTERSSGNFSKDFKSFLHFEFK